MEEVVDVPVFAEEEFIPAYASDLAAGADVKACIIDEMVIPAGESALIPSGIKVEIPVGYEIQVRPRSGLAFKSQVTVLNTPGTIDADYRGEIGIILINHGKKPFHVTRGMRIAQLVLAKVSKASFSLVREALSSTSRGDGGFGHSGTH
jgi:dUTP pyrophosphatase